METVRNYRDLIGWQKAMGLVTEVYYITKAFPKDEIYGLTNQLRRAAVSFPSNIAEGSSRKSTAEFIRYLNIALGSFAEVETQIIIAENLKYLDDVTQILKQTSEVGKILQGLHNSLNSKL